MSTITTPQLNRAGWPVDLVRRAWQINPLLTIGTIAVTLTALFSLLGLFFDTRMVQGMPTWNKTLKFSLSIGIYHVSLLMILTQVTRFQRVLGWIFSLSGAVLLFETGLIVVQGARAVPMHYNVATPFDEVLWSAMSITVLVLYLLTFVGWLVLLREPLADRALRWAVRLGLLIAIIGMGQGYLMPFPTPDQQQQLLTGQAVALIGAHTVGAPDGGPGLPFTGWSTQHGDLRIGHFIGLHGLQVVPLFALLVVRPGRRRLRSWAQLALVCVGAAGYLGLVALVTWQALRGQPLLAPDAQTLGALAALVCAVALAGGLVAWRGAVR